MATQFSSSEGLKIIRRQIPLVGQESTIAISLSLPDGSPVPVTPSCSLTPPDNGRCILWVASSQSVHVQCTVKESSQSGQYNVVFTPFTRGQHQLHVTISGVTVPGSPISVPVTVPFKIRDKPIRTITGLSGPSGVAVTDNGLLVVSEWDSHCITVMDREGKKIRSFGSRGDERGQLEFPLGVAITSKGTILAVDGNNNRIQEYTMEGDCISCVGAKGDGPLQFSHPTGITINKATGQVFIADYSNNRVQVLNPDLTFSHVFGSWGSKQGQFQYPLDVTIDSKGFVYVTDRNNYRIQKFTTEGQFVSLFKGTRSPSSITVDNNDLVYVNNSNNDDVTVYTTSGEHIGTIKKPTTLYHCIHLPGIACDNNNGYLYVCCDNVIKVC